MSKSIDNSSNVPKPRVDHVDLGGLMENFCDETDWDIVEYHFRQQAVQLKQAEDTHIEAIVVSYSGAVSSASEISHPDRYQLLHYLLEEMRVAALYYRDPSKYNTLFVRIMRLLNTSPQEVEQMLKEESRHIAHGGW